MEYVNVVIEDLPKPNHGTPKVTIKCSCGEQPTKLLAEAVPWAYEHVRQHGEGRIHYKDMTRAISRNGGSRPLLGASRFEAHIRSNHG